MAKLTPGRYQGRDPATGRKMLDGVTAIVSERTGAITYQARWHWYDATDRRRQKTVTRKSLDEAEQLQLKAELAMRDGTYATDAERQKKLTMNQYVAEWIKRESLNWEPSTILMRKSWWRRAFAETIGDVPVSRITRSMCQAEILRLVELKKEGKDKESVPQLSATTVRHYAALLKQILNAAVDDEIIASNPARRLTIPKPSGAKTASWSAETAAAFLAKTAESECNLLWWFLATTGARIGEALTLRWSDVDLVNGAVTFRSTIQRQEDGRWGIKEGTKTTKSPAWVPLIPTVTERLATLRREDREGQIVAIDPYVFRPPFAERWKVETVRIRLRRDCEQAGVPAITPHGFRHTTGTLLVGMRVPESMVMQILRHKSIVTTLGTYVHPSKDDLRAAVGQLEGALSTTTQESESAENTGSV